MRGDTSHDSLSTPSNEPNIRLRQLRIISAGYTQLNKAEPDLPLPNSPLPAVLALRNVLNTVDQTKLSIKETDESIKKTRAHLRKAESELRETQAIEVALSQKIEKLQVEKSELSKSSPKEWAESELRRQHEAQSRFMNSLAKLVTAFNTFVEDTLSPMVAAEDLGGPVVGDLIDVQPETLKAGFTKQGRPKKLKVESIVARAARKQRNDEVWGLDNPRSDEVKDERKAAGASFRALTEDLLNAAADEDSSPYIRLTQDSAAVRFLVRARVAQFHPEDANKLRLIDFSKDLDDQAIATK